MDIKIYKLLKNGIGVKEISESWNIPESEIFRQVLSDFKCFPYECELYSIHSHSIIFTDYTFSDLGIESIDISNLSEILTSDPFNRIWRRKVIYVDHLEKFNRRKWKLLSKLQYSSIPIIISYLGYKKDIKIDGFKNYDFRTKLMHIKEFVNKYYPSFDKNVENIYHLSGNDAILTLRNIAYSDISNIIVNRQYTVREVVGEIFYRKSTPELEKKLFMMDGQWWYVLSWIRYNAPFVYKNFSSLMRTLKCLEYVSTMKHKINAKYLVSYLVYNVTKAEKRAYIKFPQFLHKKKKVKEEKHKIQKMKYKKKPQKRITDFFKV